VRSAGPEPVRSAYGLNEPARRARELRVPAPDVDALAAAAWDRGAALRITAHLVVCWPRARLSERAGGDNEGSVRGVNT
jgi:hypothetical protein